MERHVRLLSRDRASEFLRASCERASDQWIITTSRWASWSRHSVVAGVARRCSFRQSVADRFPAESFWWGKLPELESRKPAGLLLGLRERRYSDGSPMLPAWMRTAFAQQFTWQRCVVVFQVKRWRPETEFRPGAKLRIALPGWTQRLR